MATSILLCPCLQYWHQIQNVLYQEYKACQIFMGVWALRSGKLKNN